LAGGADERHCLGEEHAHRITESRRLLVRPTGRLHLLQRGGREFDGRAQRQGRELLALSLLDALGLGLRELTQPTQDLLGALREFAERQAETVQAAQREQFATLTLNTAVELTAAALQQVNATGGADEQAIALRDAMRVLFPEAVALVSAARQGFMRES